MAVYIAAVHMAGGTQHEHISDLIWMNQSTYKSGKSTKAEMVKFIDDGNAAKVSDGTTHATIGVVRETGKAPYLRTFADKKWTDNLLAVQRY
jgi:hypothetical protein